MLRWCEPFPNRFSSVSLVVERNKATYMYHTEQLFDDYTVDIYVACPMLCECAGDLTDVGAFRVQIVARDACFLRVPSVADLIVYHWLKTTDFGQNKELLRRLQRL